MKLASSRLVKIFELFNKKLFSKQFFLNVKKTKKKNYKLLEFHRNCIVHVHFKERPKLKSKRDSLEDYAPSVLG